MTDDIRNILDPASSFSDEDVKGLLAHAQKKKSELSGWTHILNCHFEIDLFLENPVREFPID